MSPIRSAQLLTLSLILVILLGLGLRVYHFSDWLHFELDQARDARVIDAALEGGPGELPLLGPKAGGTFLRLAPGYYYLQYISGLIFGATPVGIALVVVILSILSIGLFYLLVRRFFVDFFALGLTLLFSVSAYFVMYGRFAWNPNILPFFVLLSFYALLRSVDTEERNRNRWFLVAVLAGTLGTQAHFLAFLSLPTIICLFLFIKRPYYSLRTWLGALGIITVLYLPVVLNEIQAGGTNTKEFFHAITEKSTKEDHPFIEKFVRNASEHALGALIITTGFEGGTVPAITWNQGRFWWVCAEKCDKGKWYGVTALALLGLSVLALVFTWFIRRKDPGSERDFLTLMGIWFFVTFALFLPLSYGFAPRFFLLSGPLFIILLGILLYLLRTFLGSQIVAHILIFTVLSTLIVSNLYFLFSRFDELSRAGTEAVKNAPDRILKERIRVTLEQQNRIVDFLTMKSTERGYPVYMFSEPQHRRALKYLLEKRGVENAVLGFDGVYRQGVYYLILRAQSDLEDALRKYRMNYEVGTTTPFGTLVAIELIPKPEAVIGERQDFTLDKPSDSKAPPRYTWKEFFSSGSANDTADTGALDQVEDEESNQDN